MKKLFRKSFFNFLLSSQVPVITLIYPGQLPVLDGKRSHNYRVYAGRTAPSDKGPSQGETIYLKILIRCTPTWVINLASLRETRTQKLTFGYLDSIHIRLPFTGMLPLHTYIMVVRLQARRWYVLCGTGKGSRLLQTPED